MKSDDGEGKGQKLQRRKNKVYLRKELKDEREGKG